MWPLLLFSVATIAIILERAAYFLYHDLRIDDLEGPVEQYLSGGDIPGAREYLKPLLKRRMGARVLLALVNHLELSEHRLEKAVETEALGCINSLENGLNFLTALGSLAPLTGFLGTVTGMIGAFRSISEAAEVNAQIVANGIYEALITTVFGLMIAIVAIAAYHLFTNAVDRFAIHTDKTCSDLITALAVSQSKSSRAEDNQ
jgi:biopolymer transport protein ExbB